MEKAGPGTQNQEFIERANVAQLVHQNQHLVGLEKIRPSIDMFSECETSLQTMDRTETRAHDDSDLAPSLFTSPWPLRWLALAGIEMAWKCRVSKYSFTKPLWT